MKFIIFLLVSIFIFSNINNSNCNLISTVQQQQEQEAPIISSIYTLLIKQDGSSGNDDYLNIYVYGVFSNITNNDDKKKIIDNEIQVYFNDVEIKNFTYQHDNSNFNNNPKNDLVLFQLYGINNIKVGNITLIYGNGGLKSNSMSFELQSYINQIKKPDTTGGLLELIGNFYFTNNSKIDNKSIISIGPNNEICEIISISNSRLKCYINNNQVSNLSNGLKVNLSLLNIYNLVNKSIEFSFAPPSIDNIIGIDRINECQITIIGKNLDKQEKQSIQSVFIKEDNGSIRNCSNPPILVTNSIYICNLFPSFSKTTVGDKFYYNSLNTYVNIDQVSEGSSQKSNQENIDYNNTKEGNNDDQIKTLILLAIILPSILIFVFIIILIVLIFKKTSPINSNDYFRLMYCSNELDDSNCN